MGQVWVKSPSQTCLVFLDSLPGFPNGKFQSTSDRVSRWSSSRRRCASCSSPPQRALIAGELGKARACRLAGGARDDAANFPFSVSLLAPGERAALDLCWWSCSKPCPATTTAARG